MLERELYARERKVPSAKSCMLEIFWSAMMLEFLHLKFGVTVMYHIELFKSEQAQQSMA